VATLAKEKRRVQAKLAGVRPHLITILVAGALLAAGVTPAGADKCNGAKVKAIGKEAAAVLGCSAGEAKKSGTEPACDSKVSGRFAKSYDKPTGCSPSAPTDTTCETAVDVACQTAIRAVLPDGNGTTPSKCEAARLKAAGNLASAELNCISKAAIKGIAIDSGCVSKATANFTKAFNKVRGCTGDGNASGIQADVENDCVNNMARVTGGNFAAITCPNIPSYIPWKTFDYTASGADFLVIGDWGNQADITDMTNVATAMNSKASTSNSNFVISLGSNFYRGGIYAYDGVQSVDDPKFVDLWKDVYSGAALSQLPWWLILGNHDWYVTSSPTYEMQHQDPNWNIPDYFHVRRFALPNSKHATLIFIETDLLFYGYAGKTGTSMAANFQAAGWSAAANTQLKQLAWIDKALETANQDDYVLVFGHHPVFTCGVNAAVWSTGNKLDALIEKWKPTAYINSFHHTLAYYVTDPTLQIQVGSGGNIDAPCAPLAPATGSEVANTYGFADARLTGSQFEIEFVTETGVSAMQTSTPGRTPVVGVQADETYLPPAGDPSIHAQ
jgi:hypothetical protein